MNTTEPLRLAVGSHQAGSGKGCAMNVVSWENGDTQITDLPDCADPMLARVVQRVNDTICRHTTDALLCPECSIKVLDLAHRTVGTGTVDGLTDELLRKVWVELACEEAERVLPIFEARFPTDDRPRKAIEAARAGKHVVGVGHAAAVAAAETAFVSSAVASAETAFTSSAVASAASACAYAAVAAGHAAEADLPGASADDVHAANTDASAAFAASAVCDASAAYAAYTALAAASCAVEHADRLTQAHRIIDRFYELTGLAEHPTDPAITEQAVERMAVVG